MTTGDGLERLVELGAPERYLGVLVTQYPDGRPQVAVVNFGLVDHPTTGETCVALVARRGAKLANLRRTPTATLVVRAGWEWIAVTGPVTLAGPDDPHTDVDSHALRLLLREIFHAAGGQHDDLDRYDEVMAAERRTAVLITPQRFLTNPPAADHQEPNR